MWGSGRAHDILEPMWYNGQTTGFGRSGFKSLLDMPLSTTRSSYKGKLNNSKYLLILYSFEGGAGFQMLIIIHINCERQPKQAQHCSIVWGENKVLTLVYSLFQLTAEISRRTKSLASFPLLSLQKRRTWTYPITGSDKWIQHPAGRSRGRNSTLPKQSSVSKLISDGTERREEEWRLGRDRQKYEL